jgi:hypothetical protein
MHLERFLRYSWQEGYSMQSPFRVPRARSMLLHVWEEPIDQPPYHTLRLRVESIGGQQREFGSPEALAAYLRAVMVRMEVDARAEETYASRS